MVAHRVIDGRQGAPAAEIDLAVLQDPDSRTLTTAWRALREGGACYVEWSTPLPIGPRFARNRLVAAGFRDVRCYWPRPAPDAGPAVVWLPIDDSQALARFAGSDGLPRTPARSLRHLVRRLQLGIAPAVHLGRPFCAVGWKDTHDTPRLLGRAVNTRWKEWRLGSPPEQATCLLVTPGHRAIGKAVTIVFRRGDGRPRAVVKMPRVPESLPRLRHEAAVLEGLAQRPQLPPGIPARLAWEERAGTAMLVESFVNGVPLPAAPGPTAYRDIARIGTEWLVKLAHATAAMREGDARDSVITPALMRFERDFGAVADPALLRSSRARLAAIPPLVSVCEHRDFGPWNLRRATDGGLGVLDWESATLAGLPVLDLVYFLTYLAFSAAGAGDVAARRECYQRALLSSHPVAAVASEALERYTSAVGVPAEAVPGLRLLTWIVHARSDHAHLAADAGGPPTPAALRGSLFFGLWQEELRRVS